MERKREREREREEAEVFGKQQPQR